LASYEVTPQDVARLEFNSLYMVFLHVISCKDCNDKAQMDSDAYNFRYSNSIVFGVGSFGRQRQFN
jgi:hypothetical protein